MPFGCRKPFGALAAVCIGLTASGCTLNRLPINPPRLALSAETDMAIQLFMQATILLSNHYGYPTIRYSELQARSARAGFSSVPFMAPETVRATPELIGFYNTYENNPDALRPMLEKHGGYKVLVKYYIRTGLRASQSICRNYLLNLEERNQYLDCLQREIGVIATLSTGILTLVNANATIAKGFLIGRSGIDGAIDAYQEYRFLNVDREAARIVVEAAQQKLAEHYLQQVDSASPGSNSAMGGYTFSDALNAVSVIEYQCTRSGIRQLLNRSINNSPTNMGVDQETGQIFFRSAKGAVESGPLAPALKPARLSAPPPLPYIPAGPVVIEPGSRPVVFVPAAVPVEVPPPPLIDAAAAAAEMERFIQPNGPGSGFNSANRERLQVFLNDLTVPARPPNLLSVLRSEAHIALRMRLYAAFKGR